MWWVRSRTEYKTLSTDCTGIENTLTPDGFFCFFNGYFFGMSR